ncbi:unnamed protein product [Clonostachys rhizophaga]|uniref:Uncharacterized protein n=1 Tax=Clonostachys rhizophaga TaxID=160324 RepID=A0A9N9VUJ9_9HYPO|nr:unnamed protein product [Clonostachys rhizophaga]
MIARTTLVISSFLVLAAQAKIINYPRPSIYSESKVFSLLANGTEINTIDYAGYDYAHLAMDAGHATTFSLTATGEKEINDLIISPRALKVNAKTAGNKLKFSISKPQYLIIKVNKVKEMVILVDYIEKDPPKPKACGIFNVLNYKADNTGKTITEGIQTAMDAAAKRPGSTVYVPPGVYQIGNLVLRNHTSLYLAAGSVLRFTGNIADYDLIFSKPFTGVGRVDGTWWLQTEFYSTDIKIFGRGTIDGNGYSSRQNKSMAHLVVPVGTRNFRYDGPLIRDGSFWTVVPTQSEDAYLTNLKVLNRKDVTQNDGVDVVESKRITVKRSIAIGNDDSYSAKTWEADNEVALHYPYKPLPNQDIVFDDCLAWTNCYGYKIGQGVVENQDNVTFKNSVVYNAGVGIGIHHLYGWATASRITFDNIDVEDQHGNSGGVASWIALFINGTAKRGVGPVTDVVVKNIHARKQGSREGYAQGFNSSIKLSGVRFSDIFMYANKTPATSLKEMNILRTEYCEGVKIANTKDQA